MAHLVKSMAFVGDVPWHGLGVPVDGDLTPRQMQIAAGADWRVEKVDNFIRVKDTVNGQLVDVDMRTGQQSLIRIPDNHILAANVGPDWEPLQNDEAFEFFADLVAAGDMRMHTAGVLKDGEIVWALAEIDDEFTLFNGDHVRGFLLLANFMRYGKAIKTMFTPIRVVCANTLQMALSRLEDGSVSWAHKTKFDGEKVKEMLGIAHRRLEDYRETAELLGSVQYKDTELLEFFSAIHPVANRGDKGIKKELSKHAKACLDIIGNQPGAEFAPHSWWQAFNAVTYNVDHIMCKTQDQRLTEAYFGAQVRTKQKAFELAVDYAKGDAQKRKVKELVGA